MTRNAAFEDEKKKTEECRADLVKLLSHDTSSTRQQLIRVLVERIELIEIEIKADVFLDSEFARIARDQPIG